MKKTGREQPPILATESKRATIYAQRRQIDSRKKIYKVDNDADGHQQHGGGISRQASHGHGAARAARGHASATITQNRRDSFFIHGKGCTAFKAVRHVLTG